MGWQKLETTVVFFNNIISQVWPVRFFFNGLVLHTGCCHCATNIGACVLVDWALLGGRRGLTWLRPILTIGICGNLGRPLPLMQSCLCALLLVWSIFSQTLSVSILLVQMAKDLVWIFSLLTAFRNCWWLGWAWPAQPPQHKKLPLRPLKPWKTGTKVTQKSKVFWPSHYSLYMVTPFGASESLRLWNGLGQVPRFGVFSL